MYSPEFFTHGSNWRFKRDFARPIQGNFREITHNTTRTTPTFTQTSAYDPTFTDYVLLPFIILVGIPRLTLIHLLEPYAPRPVETFN